MTSFNDVQYIQTFSGGDGASLLRLRDVHELVDVGDDVRSDQHEATEVATVHAADGDWRTVQLRLRKQLKPTMCELTYMYNTCMNTLKFLTHSRTTLKNLTGVRKFGFFLEFWMVTDDSTWPAHSMSMRGLSTD